MFLHRVEGGRRGNTKTAVRHLLRFVGAFKIKFLPLTQIETVVFLYLTWKSRQVKVRTVESYLSKIRNFYVDVGILQDIRRGVRGRMYVHEPLVAKWVQGLRKFDTTRSRRSFRFVLDVIVVARLGPVMRRDTHDGKLLWFLLCLMVMRCLRIDDVAPPKKELEDIHPRKLIYGKDFRWFPSIAAPTQVVLTKWWRKHSPYSAGCDLGYKKTNVCVCTVEAGKDYFDSARIGPDDEVFRWEDGSLVTAESFKEAVGGALLCIGVDLTEYHGLSTRKGGAQSGAWAGLTDEEIRLLGDWAAGSGEFARYRRRTVSEIADLATRMVSTLLK